MILNGLYNGTFSVLERSLNLRSKNHQLIASNIANLDTPEYKAFKMDVSDALKPKHSNVLSVDTTHSNHLSPSPEGSTDVRIKP